jgi:DNA-nicking Smr family endonuclease
MPENNDKDIWDAYAKSVKPIRRAKKTRAVMPVKKPAAAHPAKINSPSPNKEVHSRKAEQPPALLFDRRAERRLKQGDIEVDARLDLHGMRQDEAHEALNAFIARQVKTGHRTLLVITGKGRNGSGVLRSNLAGWLAVSSHESHILALRPAAIRHGGEGAFYVLLKKRKSRHE